MEPAAIVQKYPERFAPELAEIGDHRSEHLLLPLIMQRPREVMMIDDEGPLFRPQDDRDHVPAEIPASSIALLAPPMPLSLHLAKADRKLGRAKIVDRDRDKHGFSAVSHGCTC
jgi:hypothetical protein